MYTNFTNGEPVRTSADDADFFVKWIDNLIQQTSAGGAWSGYLADDRERAQARYRKAKAIFEEIGHRARRQAENP